MLHHWSTMHSTELCCTLLSYSAHYWAVLQPSELRCTLLSYDKLYWAMVHPPSYATPNWATINSNDLRCTLMSSTVSSISAQFLTPYIVKIHAKTTEEKESRLCSGKSFINFFEISTWQRQISSLFLSLAFSLHKLFFKITPNLIWPSFFMSYSSYIFVKFNSIESCIMEYFSP